MLAIVFSTAQEAAPFVEQHLGGRSEDLEEGRHIRSGDLLVAVTGTGKIKATLNTERLLQEYDLDSLVHTGGCRSLTDEIENGTLVGVSFVLEGDRIDLEAPSYPRMPLECPFEVSVEGTLVTQDHTRDDQDERSYWERMADIRDTTGYAVAYVAAQHGTPCHIVKAVTAPADAEEATGDALAEVYGTLATFLEDYLESTPESVNS